MKIFTILVASLLTLSLTSCQYITPRDGEDMTTEEKANVLQGFVRAGMTVAILKIYEDDVESQNAAADRIVRATDNVTVGEIDPDAEIITIVIGLLNNVQNEDAKLIAITLNLISASYVTPTLSELSESEYTVYLEALVNGLQNGAFDVLRLNGVVGS